MHQEVPVNKSELVDQVASQSGVSKGQAESVITALFDTLKGAAKRGDRVAWPGFGSFSTSQRAARTGRNPRTGAPVSIAASTAMKFTSSSGLKDFLNSRGGTKQSGAKKAGAKKAAKRR
jgi:DNA-binding protein HU-beta